MPFFPTFRPFGGAFSFHFGLLGTVFPWFLAFSVCFLLFWSFGCRFSLHFPFILVFRRPFSFYFGLLGSPFPFILVFWVALFLLFWSFGCTYSFHFSLLGLLFPYILAFWGRLFLSRWSFGGPFFFHFAFWGAPFPFILAFWLFFPFHLASVVFCSAKMLGLRLRPKASFLKCWALGCALRLKKKGGLRARSKMLGLRLRPKAEKKEALGRDLHEIAIW